MRNVHLLQEKLVSFFAGVGAAGLIRYLIDDLSGSRLLLNSLAISGGLIFTLVVRSTLRKQGR